MTTRVATMEDCEGRKIVVETDGRVVRLVIPATPKSEVIELAFGPMFAEKFGLAMMLAAEVAGTTK
jgi:hypothetical protein